MDFINHDKRDLEGTKNENSKIYLQKKASLSYWLWAKIWRHKEIKKATKQGNVE
jgi:hypothetical protein